jgi:DNA (cytosine-5)-methyltransferase 1
VNELACFAGAGGGLLASRLLGWRPICAIEWNRSAAAILAARQRDGLLERFPIWDDIRTFDGRPLRGRVDVVSGGFPCQGYSTAAAGNNTADDLWPEQRRIVADVAPRYVWAENVQRRAINRAADDLEAMGYETRALSLSASDLGGDHIRPRHWLLAYADDPRELLRAVHAEACLLPDLGRSVWEGEPGSAGVVDGLAGRLDRLTATGNGQVPVVAVAALITIARAACGMTSPHTMELAK